MKFENVRVGLGKVYKAEIISIIAAIIAIVASVLLTVMGKIISTDGESINVTDVISVISMLVAVVFGIIAFFLNISGINTASKEDESFKNALILLIVGIIASLVYSFLNTRNSSLAGLFDSIHNISELFVSYFVLNGCISVARQKGNEQVAESSKKAIRLIIIVWVIAIAFSILSSFLGTDGVKGTIFGIVGIAETVLSLISYLIYLRALRKTIDIL